MAMFETPQEKLSTFQKIGRGLSGFGAGVQGRGPEYLQSLNNQREQLSDERKRAAAEDLRRVQGMLKTGNLNGVRDLAKQRIGFINQLGGDPKDTQMLLSLAERAEDDPIAYEMLLSEVDSGLKAAADAGFADLTNDPATQQTADQRNFDSLVQKAQLTPEEEARAARIRLKLEAGEGTLDVEERLWLAKMTAGIEVDKAKSMSKIEREEMFIDNAFSAVSELPDLNRAVELVEMVKTGGIEAVKMQINNFFGRDVGDIGELNNLLGAEILAGLAAFTGAISEGEREFIKQMNAGIEKGQDVNAANLRRLVRIKNNAIRNGTRILEVRVKNGDTEAQEILNELQAQMGQASQGNNVKPVDLSGLSDEELDAAIAELENQ